MYQFPIYPSPFSIYFACSPGLTQTVYVTQEEFELMILLTPAARCRNYKLVPPHLPFDFPFLELYFLSQQTRGQRCSLNLTVSYIFSCVHVNLQICNYIISYNDINNYMYTYFNLYKYIQWLHDKNLLIHVASVSGTHVATNATANTPINTF